MATSIDQQFIEYIVKSLVNKPDAVSIERRIDEKGVLLELTVDQEDLGRVIGKRGATAQSLRTLLRALGTKNDARYNLKIIDNGPGYGPGPSNSSGSSQSRDDDQDDHSTQDDNDDHHDDHDDRQEKEPETQAAPEHEDKHEDAGNSDSISRTRQELAELDDLDL